MWHVLVCFSFGVPNAKSTIKISGLQDLLLRSKKILIGELYALICAVCWATAVVLFKHAGNSLSASGLNLTKNIIGVVLLVPTSLLVEGLVFPDLSLSHWLIVVVSGYFGLAVADTWFLQALRNLGAGRTAIVASLYSPFVIVLSIIFLGERLALWQWTGFILVLIGIFIVSYQRHYQNIEKTVLIKGIAFAACSVFVTAASVVVMKPILVNDGFFWLITLRMLAGVAGMIAYLQITKRLLPIIHDVSHKQHKWGTVFMASVFGTYLAIIFWLAGFKYADASIASVLNETSNVMIVLFAWLFLKEALTTTKVVGAICTFIGVLIFMDLVPFF